MTSEQQDRTVPGPVQTPVSRKPAGRIPVRLKLVAILVLPMVLLVVSGVGQILGVQRDAEDAQAEAELTEVVLGPGSLLGKLVDERNRTAVHLLGAEDFFPTVEEGEHLAAREEADTAIDDFLELVATDSEIEEIYQPAVDALATIEDVRATVDETPDEDRGFSNIGAAREYLNSMSTVIDPVFEANAAAKMTIDHEHLRHGVNLADQANRQFNTSILITFQLALVAIENEFGEGGAGIDEPGEYLDVISLYEQLRAGDDELRRHGVGEYGPYVEELYASDYVPNLYSLIEEAIETGTPVVGDVFSAVSNQDTDAYTYSAIRDDAEVVIREEADEINDEASQARLLFLIASLLVILLVGAVTTLVAISITRPLRQLTRQAKDMCDVRLPRAVQGILETPPGENVTMPELPPIEVQTRDEVAEVADALTSVQQSAVELAVEQAALRRNIADSYVNLGRRNQTLVGRQLDFITELEKNEADPEALANLFKLDHLATRMRRNAESLLVLAGIEPPRTWSAPVRLTDVVRASLGEVEDYQRVAVRGVEPATIVGSAAADLAHLLAELIENALTFSPPDQAVEIRGRFTPVQTAPPLGGPADIGDGSGGYTLAIVDSGLGMTTDDIERANRRLAGQESFTIAPSKYLGHYVAGMIAVRHGIQVQLHSSPQRGVTATLILPPKLLSSQEAPAMAVPAGPTGGEPTPPSALGAVDTPLAPLGAGSAGTASPFGPRSGETPTVDLSGPAVASPAYLQPGPAPIAGGPAAVPTPAVPVGTAPPGRPTGGVPDRSVSDEPTRVGGEPPRPVTSEPATYRIGETEFTIDLGTSSAALPTGEDQDRNQLIQRIQGAQMPQTQLASLSRRSGNGGGGGGPAAPVTAQTPTTTGNGGPGGTNGPVRDEARAGQVRNFLSSFSSGLEQGRDAAAREMVDPSDEA